MQSAQRQIRAGSREEGETGDGCCLGEEDWMAVGWGVFSTSVDFEGGEVVDAADISKGAARVTGRGDQGRKKGTWIWI